MYVQFFGLHRLPFRLRPDREFTFPVPEFAHGVAALTAGFRGPLRIGWVSGPAGVGKTLLLEQVLDAVGGAFCVCRINQPLMSTAELLKTLCLQLGGGGTPEPDPGGMLAALERHPRPALVSIDDAHLLAAHPMRTMLELVRRLPSLHVLLAGRDDQAGRLAVEAEAEAGRRSAVTRATVHLAPLTPPLVAEYVRHRLTAAGGGERSLFADDAMRCVVQLGAGVPRLINVLADGALHAASLRASQQVAAADVLAAAQAPSWTAALARQRAKPEAVSAAEPGGEAGRGASLLVTHRGRSVGVWPLEAGRITIGRALENDVHLDSDVVSRNHCQVITEGDESTIEDLGSVNGLIVNGHAAKRHLMRDGDRIRVGDFLLLYKVG